MTSQSITPELQRWILEQAEGGHGAESILQAMRASGWDEDVAVKALEETLLAHVQTLPAAIANGIEDLAIPRIDTDGNAVWAHDREVGIVSSLNHPRVVVLADVLSAEECSALIDLATPRLTRSETVQDATGGSEVNEARTSQGMFFGRQESELIDRIEQRLSALMNWPIERGEGLQVLRYAPGAEYKPHYDYFDPERPGTAAVLKRGGQRVGTLVMYLNTPEKGGATTFPDVGLSVHATQGHAVFFSYALPVPSTRTLHGGAPVTEGEKWVATKWLRQGRFD
jgi:prolyl 4-hydroxylase